jgi:hypothetical protein
VEGVPARRIARDLGRRAVALARTGEADRETIATAVRYALQEISLVAPGKSVEIRVPPFGAVQAIEGPGHTRGTPPNVIETDAETFLGLVVGDETWADAVARGVIRASGTRADLTELLPFVEWRE